MTGTARRRRNHARSDRGIALVETLASLVVVSMIALMIVEGVGTGRRVWERIDAREASAEVIESAQQMLRDRLQVTYPRTLYDEDPPTVDFQGARDTVVFIANPPGAGQPAPSRGTSGQRRLAGGATAGGRRDGQGPCASRSAPPGTARAARAGTR